MGPPPPGANFFGCDPGNEGNSPGNAGVREIPRGIGKLPGGYSLWHFHGDSPGNWLRILGISREMNRCASSFPGNRQRGSPTGNSPGNAADAHPISRETPGGFPGESAPAQFPGKSPRSLGAAANFPENRERQPDFAVFPHSAPNLEWKRMARVGRMETGDRNRRLWGVKHQAAQDRIAVTMYSYAYFHSLSERSTASGATAFLWIIHTFLEFSSETLRYTIEPNS